MSEERLWKFRKPEWMNSATTRSAGVYGSGALVGHTFWVCFVSSAASEVGWGDGCWTEGKERISAMMLYRNCAKN
jgi:hypothetical protein